MIFIFFFLYYNEKIKANKISFIKNYNDCLNEIKKENKFYFFDAKKKIISKFVKQNIIAAKFYYENKKESFIIFSDKKKKFKLKELKNNFWKLLEYEEKKNIDIIKSLNEKIKKNKNIDNLQIYLNKEYKDFSVFYLINEKWIKNKLNKKNKNLDSFLPETKIGEFEFKYPVKFEFLDKKFNQELIERLLKEDNTINNQELYEAKIFFLFGNNDILKKNANNKNIYLGILDKKKDCIYFYTYGKESYIIEFIIFYTKNNIIIDEINNKIRIDGIEKYLYKMGINLLSEENSQNIINYELEKIGIFFNLNKNRIYNNPKLHSRILSRTDTYYYNGVIQCLVHIGPLKDIFLNRNKLMEKRIVQDNKTITKNFYKLMQDMWYINQFNKNIDNNNNEDDESSQNFIFISEIGKYNVFKDIKSLIGLLLLSMHFEQKLNNNNDFINYNINEFEKSINENEKSFISELFFFKLFNKKQNKCSINYMLIFEIDNAFFKNENEKINISTLLSSKKININFNNNEKLEITKVKFESCPKILIILLKLKSNHNFKLYSNEEIDINDLILDKNKNNVSKYELISAIENLDNYYKTYCKSEEKMWYEFIEADLKQNFNECKSLKQKLDNPYLLIYKQCEKKSHK